MKMSNNPAKHEVLTKQYLRSILDISGDREYASTFQSYIPEAPFQAAPHHRSLSIPPGASTAAGAWHS